MSRFSAPAILPIGYGTTVAEYADGMIAVIGDNGYMHICCADDDGLFVVKTMVSWKGTALEAANRAIAA